MSATREELIHSITEGGPAEQMTHEQRARITAYFAVAEVMLIDAVKDIPKDVASLADAEQYPILHAAFEVYQKTHRK